jgi:hypothetical protein
MKPAAQAHITVKKRSKVIRWLGEVPRAKHDDATSLRHEQSGLWLLSNPIFSDWVSATSSSFFWLNGIRESSKLTSSKNAN